MNIVEPSVQLEWCTARPEQEIEHAGRTCYKSEDRITDGSAAKFIKMIMHRGHESVIEHASASFRIICDRGISHEIVRHRLASYSQESTRYCNYGKKKHGGELNIIEPPFADADASTKRSRRWRQSWEHAVEQIESAYLLMVADGCPPQLARSVLPNCLKTEIVMTCNFREWRHFIRLRASKAAHPQIRPIAKMIHAILVRQAPTVFGDFIFEE